MNKIENLKKSIQTILNQFPKYYVKFEISEREIVKDFLAVINRFGEADNKRTTLTKHFNHYSENIIKTSEYLTSPFLWYTVSLSMNAVINLSISRFYALEFYKFLLYQLRELHQLIKEGTKLSSYKYEQLQVKCMKADFKLTSDEFEMLKTTYSAIKSDKSESLGSRYIKKKINENTTILSKYKRKSEVSRFYTLIGGKWSFQFKSTSFGLNRVFFHIQLAENTELRQLIDFKNPENTVLGLSEVHHVPNLKNEYIGTLLVPDRDINILHDYFQRCEQNNSIKFIDFAPIIQASRSTAFTLYKPDKGWQNLPAKQQKTIIQNLLTSGEEERHFDDTIIPSPWSFTKYPYPLDIIKFYCKSPDQFSYLQLPYDKRRGEAGNQFSLAEIGILRYLINKNALEIGFAPWRLIYNYSVTKYCIKLPKLHLKTLTQFLNIIPYGETYFSNQRFYILTFLPLELIPIIKNGLKWTILPIVRNHPVSEIKFSWFDNKKLQWIRPKVLNK